MPGTPLESGHVVMGVHWDPQEEPIGRDASDLDALCVLLDNQRHVLEIIHPGYPRNANGSVLHTGDSRSGASTWDDERIFVFLGALPPLVSALTFLVVSVTGRAFGTIAGATCHVSDHVTDTELVRLDLTSLETRTVYCVATVCRSLTGWGVSAEAETLDGELPRQILLLIQTLKSRVHSQPNP